MGDAPTRGSAPGFVGFTLGELQLLALGLWVLGEEDRVDFNLMPEYRGLSARLRVALQREVVVARDGGQPDGLGP